MMLINYIHAFIYAYGACSIVLTVGYLLGKLKVYVSIKAQSKKEMVV